MSDSPYKPPQTQVTMSSDGRRPFTSRKVEAEIRYFGVFLLLLAVVPLFGTVVLFSENMGSGGIIIGIVALLLLLTGVTLTTRRTPGRFLGIGACCLGVLLFPLGTIICFKPLKTLLSDEGKRVFTSEYSEWLRSDSRPKLPIDPVFAALILLTTCFLAWGIYDAVANP